MRLFCNWLRLTGSNKRLKTLAAHLLTTFCKSFLSWFAQSRMKKSNAYTRTGISHGGASAYWFVYSTVTANKSFTGSLESRVTACPNILTTFQTSITRTNINANFWHSNMTSNFTGVWQRITTALIGMYEFYGKCIARTGA